MSAALATALARARAADGSGNPGEAYDALRASLDTAPRPHQGTEALLAFLRRYAPRTRHAEVDAIWQGALTETWARPADLALPIARYLGLTPAIAAALSAPTLPASLLPALEDDALLHTLLRHTVVPDPGWERLLRALAAAVLATGPHNPLPRLTETLALWAWLSERLSLPPAPARAADGDFHYAALAGVLDPATWPAHHAVPESEAARCLLHDARDERDRAAQWPAADTADTRLAAHYEAAPYPRWRHEPLGVPIASPPAVARHLATAALRRPRVLIAGCGTGQQLFVARDRFPKAELTALDLSRRSLAYAQRQCDAAGLAVTAWHCADLLAFAPGGAPFDIAECIGVLHHLPVPPQGFEALARLVRRGGLLHAAVYSRRARAPITRLREALRAEGQDPAALDVRAVRARLLDSAFGPPPPTIVHSVDFYSTSGCRDLLLNTREAVYDLPAFVAAARAAGFEWLALEAPAAVAAAAARHFGQPAERLSPAQWEAFEALHPQSFGGMFDAWFLRR